MQFWIGLVAGLIIGWIVEWIIDWRYWRGSMQADMQNAQRLQRELEEARAEIARLRANTIEPSIPPSPSIESAPVESAPVESAPVESAPVESATSSAVVDSERDRLQEIYGIGPAFEERMNQSGIFTFAQLAAKLSTMQIEAIREMLELKEWQKIDPQSWIAQANKLAAQKSERGS